ncbi:MAG: aldo/keto reductase [Fimbriimonas sp.]|nr:aldo/keto reductase [Fimbriimonas sp.]
MESTTIPGTDLSVSRLCYGMGGFDRSFPIADGLKLLGQFVDAGGNFVDSAHCYCFWSDGESGASEQFVGAAVREFGRDRIVIATKGGHIGMNGYPRPDRFMSPELVRKDLDESLQRLGIPSVDIYYLHRDDPRMAVSEIVDFCSEFVSSGRVRFLGASNWSVDRYLAANAYAASKGIPPFVVLQNQWSLASPGWSDMTQPGALRYVLESELSSLTAHHVAVAPFSSTANGFFATDGARGHDYQSNKNRARLAAAQALAKERGATPNQIALAYLLNQLFPVIPIVGTKDPEHLDDAVRATTVELSTADLAALHL